MAKKYQIVFHGKLMEGKSRASVTAALARIFKVPENRIESLVEKVPVVLKKDLDKDAAIKYRAVFNQAGLIIRTVPMPDELEPAAPPAPSPSPSPSPPPPPPPEKPEPPPPSHEKQRYDLILLGSIGPETNRDVLKVSLAGIFNTDIPKIEKLLSALPAAIKSDTDLETAEKWRETMAKAGALCQIREVGEKLSGEKPAGDQSMTQASRFRNVSGGNGMIGTTCPECGHAMGGGPRCMYCGFDVQSGKSAPPPPDIAEKIFPAGKENTRPAPEPGPFPPPVSREFFRETSHDAKTFGGPISRDKKIRSEIKKLVIGLSFTGVVLGFFNLGFWNPFPDGGVAGAFLNAVLFAGWALFLSMGLSAARSMGKAATRGKLLLGAALAGGCWVAVFVGIDFATDLVDPSPMMNKAMFGFLVGFIAGAAVSLIGGYPIARVSLARRQPPPAPATGSGPVPQMEALMTSGGMGPKIPGRGKRNAIFASALGMLFMMLLTAAASIYLFQNFKTGFDRIDQAANLSDPGPGKKGDLFGKGGENAGDLGPGDTDLGLILKRKFGDTDLQNIRELNLSRAGITDIDPLRELTGLEALDLGSTRVEDISPLENLHNLSRLSLKNTQVKDISPLASLSNLTMLDLAGTEVADITALQWNTRLTRLNLSGAPVRDLNPIRELFELSSLDISRTEVTDLNPLRRLFHLTILDITASRVDSLSPLMAHPGIARLAIAQCDVSDIDVLETLENLSFLELGKEQASRDQISNLKTAHPGLRIQFRK